MTTKTISSRDTRKTGDSAGERAKQSAQQMAAREGTQEGKPKPNEGKKGQRKQTQVKKISHKNLRKWEASLSIHTTMPSPFLQRSRTILKNKREGLENGKQQTQERE